MWLESCVEISHRYSWDSLELSGSGMESALLWRASDLEARAQKHECVRANAQQSGLILSQFSIPGGSLGHYHGTRLC